MKKLFYSKIACGIALSAFATVFATNANPENRISFSNDLLGNQTGGSPASEEVTFVQSQDFCNSFVIDVTNRFNRQSNSFNRIVRNALKENAIGIENMQVIHIPLMFVTRKGEKFYRRGKANKEDLICLLNKKKMQFNESFVFSDTTVIGKVSCFWCANINNTKFRNRAEIEFWRPLMLEIKKIAPDLIFSIHNLPQCFWYIKDNQLYVLSYEHTVHELKNFVTVKADDFIKCFIDDRDLVFLSHKIVESKISGRK